MHLFRLFIILITTLATLQSPSGRAISKIAADDYLPQLLASEVVTLKVIPEDDSQDDADWTPDWDNPAHVGPNGSQTLANNIDLNLPLDAKTSINIPGNRPDTTFSASAAGVLPISKDPTTGEIMVLFGLEYRSWDTQPKIVVTDFGGKIDPGETKKIAAAREFTEETAGAYPAYRRKALTNAGQNLIELKTSQSTHPTFKGYASYLLPMPYKDAVDIQQLADVMRQEPSNHVEKDDYYWVKLSDLLKFKDKFFVTYKGKPRIVTVYSHKQKKNIKLQLKPGSRIYLFRQYWNSILSDPAVRAYLQSFIDANRPGVAPPPAPIPPAPAPPAVSTGLDLTTVPKMPAALTTSGIDETWTAAATLAASPFKGAGVLPMSKDPATSKVVVLLGDETATQVKLGLQGFLDFGGTADHPGMGPRTLASREFMEETCFVYHEHFTGQSLDVSTLNDAKIKQMLASIQPRTEARSLLFASPTNNKYALYALPIPYLSTDELQKRRKALQARVTKKGDPDLRPLFEKGELAWVPLEDIMRESQTFTAIKPGKTSSAPIRWRFFGGRSKQNSDDGFNAPQNTAAKTAVLGYLQDIIDQNK